MQAKRLFFWLAAGALLAALSVNSGVCSKDKPARDELYRQMEAVAEVASLIQSNYVDEVDSETIIHGALRGMLAALEDPHTQFMDPDTYEMMKVDTAGEFGGLGIEISIRENLLTVISPIDDTPAVKAGIEAGDRIVKIDGEITRDITLLEAVKKLRGKPGSQVTLTIIREGETTLLEKIVTRDIIKIKAIRSAKIVEDGIGYIRLSTFAEKAPEEIKKALEDLSGQGMDSVIIDLRNNTGGALDAAVDITGLFIPHGELIVTTRGRIKSQDVEYRSKVRDGYFTQPMVVLVNGGSASASEILAGAVKDHNRGVIMGTKTFGKGSVQALLPLRDGSGIKMTTGKWFTPLGSSIQDDGITPDIIVSYQKTEAKKEELSEKVFARVEEEGVPAEEKVEEEEPYEEESDNQLDRAVDLLKGLKVYEKFRNNSS